MAHRSILAFRMTGTRSPASSLRRRVYRSKELKSPYNRPVMKRYARFRTFIRLRNTCAIFVSFIFIMLISATNVDAHSRLESSTPSAGSILPSVPPTVSMTFTEAVDSSYSSASLVASTGETVSAITLTVDPQNAQTALLAIASPDQPPGVYTIVWRVLSAVDGHATTGTLSFSAGTGSAPTISDVAGQEQSPWLTTVGRWLDLAGIMAIAGACAFVLIVTFGNS